MADLDLAALRKTAQFMVQDREGYWGEFAKAVLSLLDRIEELEKELRIAWEVSDENATAAGNAPSHE